MSSLSDLVWTERFRPTSFDELILKDKTLIENYLKNPKTIPSFIFYSSKPGTGKTSTARIIVSTLQCDCLILNSSEERGIDVIRDKISIFASSLATNDIKRCIFLDEADGLTRQAQDSLRNLMEEYSENCFFIFTANDLNKLIEPIRSRCQLISFDQPPKDIIAGRLMYIVFQESLSASIDDIDTLVENLYPDIRSMVKLLQEAKISGCNITSLLDQKDLKYKEFWSLVQAKKIPEIYDMVYSGDLDLWGFNNWLFTKLFYDYEKYTPQIITQIAFCLADNEKFWNMNCNREIIFLNNILQVVKIL